uniref:Uncharacterized protein n=1 Tax=Leersia perrieri TaxID=77586 RepID=A0A0D9W4Q0_9ORYZ
MKSEAPLALQGPSPPHLRLSHLRPVGPPAAVVPAPPALQEFVAWVGPRQSGWVVASSNGYGPRWVQCPLQFVIPCIHPMTLFIFRHKSHRDEQLWITKYQQ